MRILFFLMILCVDALHANPAGMDTYTQDFSVEFKTGAAAQRAKLSTLALYRGLDQAFSSRWDDNHIDGLKVREIMEAQGLRGTFFLNASDGWTAPTEAGVTLDGEPAKALAKALLKGGNSIGAHSLNHEFVPFLNRNKQFYEVLGCRVDREINSQSPLSAYAFSFMSVRNDLEGDSSQRDFVEILRRSGFYLHSEHTFERTLASGMLVGTMICGDGGGSDFGVDLAKELKKSADDTDKKLWVVSMHPWAQAWGGPSFSKLVKFYQRWAGNKRWWYCNQNEYAAYRYQALYGRVDAKVEGKRLRIQMLRFDPRDLNDATPLTLRLSGVSVADIVAFGGLDQVPALRESSGAVDFEMLHPMAKPVAKHFGSVVAGMQTELTRDSGGFQLKIKNLGPGPLIDMRVVLRLPLKYAAGVIKKGVGELAAGSTTVILMPAPKASREYLFNAGAAYVVAQVDGTRAGIGARDYATLLEATPKEDATFPQGHFMALGPFGSDQAALVDKAVSAGKAACVNVAGREACWSVPSEALSEQLGPEIITAGGKPNSRSFYKWDKALYHVGPDPIYFGLRSKISVKAPRALRAIFDKASVKAIYLNGQKIRGDQVDLKAGSNSLGLVYAASPSTGTFSPLHYGAWFRLVEADGTRAAQLLYQAP